MSKPEPEVLREEEMVAILRSDFQTKDVQLKEFAVKSASDSPLGLLGDHFNIIVDAVVSGQGVQKSYFAKRMPSKVPEHTVYAQETGAFYKETELYKTLFVDLENGQEKAKEGITKWHPRFYYSKGVEMLVVENLTDQGYYMYPEKCLMDEDHLKATLTSLAAMHSASIIFEEKFNSEQVNTVYEGVDLSKGKVSIGDIYSHLTFESEFSGQKDHIGNKFLEAGIASQLKLVELMPEYGPEEKKLILNKLPDILRRVYDLVKPSDRFKNVFIHGDLWANNLLFKKDKNGKVSHAMLVDFQLARFAPPAHDIMLLLYLVQDKYFLDANLRALLTHYYEAFTRELQKNSLSAETLLPWQTFLESCEVYRDLGLIMRLFYFQLILAPPDIISKVLYHPESYRQNMLVDRTDMVVECFLQNDICRTRVTEAMNEVIRKFILNN